MIIPTLILALLGAVPGDPPPAVPVPRMDSVIAVDGVLDEAVWTSAAVLRGFSQYLPVDGRPADDSTVVLVWYSSRAIHFGIRAFERHGAVEAALSDRDKIGSDDHVLLLLDTFDDRRQAFLFGVNPLGVQSDGVLSDAARSASSFASQTASGAYAVDLSPDYVFQSAGRVTADGYEVEVRIPFKSLRYQSADRQQWGINVVRRVRHSGYEDTWSPVRHSDASFLGQNGRLTGLERLSRGLVLDLNPEVTGMVTGAPGATDWDYDARHPQVGGNVRWGITNNLFLNGTVNPDFSQVEADVAQIQFDPRQSLFFPEKRPFFLDGLEQFSTPNTLIYTRRLADPIGAAKITGKVGNTNVAFLSGVDDDAVSANGSHPVSNWLRVRRDVLGQSSVGLTYTDRVERDDYNRVAAVDGRFVLGAYTLQFQGGGSATRLDDATAWAPLWLATVNRSGRRFSLTSSLRGWHPDFRAGSGFVQRVGIVHANVTPRYTLYGKDGAAVESWTGSVTLDGTWDYDRFFDVDTPNDSKLHFTGQFSFRGGWRLATAVLIESFKYPPELYADYFIERTPAGGVVDTVPYVGTDRLANLDFVLNLATPRFKTFSGSLFFVAGRDENFFEWAGADIYIGTLDLEWRPTEQLRANLLYNHTQYVRATDKSTVNRRHIPRLKVEYQLSRAIFFRVVGQYDAEQTDSLRDASRTEAPILIRQPDGTFVRATARSRNDFRVDWLFSFRPNPGTVLFAGYGASLREPEAFRFGDLRRTSDGFFVKLSYLWRV
jgi:hypothetical protein